MDLRSRFRCILKPVKQAPKLNKYFHLSEDAQATLLALEEKHTWRIQQMNATRSRFRSNDSVKGPSTYYKSIYKETFKCELESSINPTEGNATDLAFHKKTKPTSPYFSETEQILEVQHDSEITNYNLDTIGANRSKSHCFLNSNPLQSDENKFKAACDIFDPKQNVGLKSSKAVGRQRNNYDFKTNTHNIKCSKEVYSRDRPSDEEIKTSVLLLTQRSSVPDSPLIDLSSSNSPLMKRANYSGTKNNELSTCFAHQENNFWEEDPLSKTSEEMLSSLHKECPIENTPVICTSGSGVSRKYSLFSTKNASLLEHEPSSEDINFDLGFSENDLFHGTGKLKVDARKRTNCSPISFDAKNPLALSCENGSQVIRNDDNEAKYSHEERTSTSDFPPMFNLSKSTLICSDESPFAVIMKEDKVEQSDRRKVEEKEKTDRKIDKSSFVFVREKGKAQCLHGQEVEGTANEEREKSLSEESPLAVVVEEIKAKTCMGQEMKMKEGEQQKMSLFQSQSEEESPFVIGIEEKRTSYNGQETRVTDIEKRKTDGADENTLAVAMAGKGKGNPEQELRVMKNKESNVTPPGKTMYQQTVWQTFNLKKYNKDSSKDTECAGKPCEVSKKRSHERAVKPVAKKLKSGFKPPFLKVDHNQKQKTIYTKSVTEPTRLKVDALQVTQISRLSKDLQEEVACQLTKCGQLSLTLLYSNGQALVNTFYSAAEHAKVKKNAATMNKPSPVIVQSVDNVTVVDGNKIYTICADLAVQPRWRAVLLELLASKLCLKIIVNSKDFLIGLSTLLSVNVPCENIEDPALAAWLLNSDVQPMSFSHISTTAGYNITQDEPGWTQSVQACSKIMQRLRDKLKETGQWRLFSQIEMPLAPLLVGMEMRHIKVDMEAFIRFSDLLKRKLTQLEEHAFKEAGHSFTINSHPQLRQVLYEELMLDRQLPPKTKLGKTSVSQLKSTCEASLKLLAEFHPLPSVILEYRTLQKLKSTYVDGMMSCVKDGTLRTHWDQTAAATGRLTSSQPNVQAVPKLPVSISYSQASYIVGAKAESPISTNIYAREPFISNPGWVFLAADFQQIELRLLAHLSEDNSLLSMFWSLTSSDIFIVLTAQWHNKPEDQVTAVEREQTKRVVYSVMYGVGKDTLSDYINVKPETAKDILNSFLLHFPAIDSFSKKCWAFAKEHGYTETVCGRRRYFPLINSSNQNLRAQAQRQAVNFCVQGSAADLCKLAMLAVESRLGLHAHLRCRLMFQIHDELVWEVPEEQLLETKDVIQEVMENTRTLCGDFCDLTIPLTLTFSSGTTWAHLHPMKCNDKENVSQSFTDKNG